MRELSANPLYFQTRPAAGVPEEAELLAAGMLTAWAASRIGLDGGQVLRAGSVAGAGPRGGWWVGRDLNPRPTD